MEQPNSRVPPTSFGGYYCVDYICIYVRQIYDRGVQVGSFVSTTATLYPRQGWITLFLAMTQQLCGQTSVLSFAPQIFAIISNNDGNASSFVTGWSTVMIGLVKFLITVLVIWKIETFGRRPLLLSGIAAIALGLFMLILASGVQDSSVAEVSASDTMGNGNEGTSADEEESGMNGFFLALMGVMFVVCGYSMSFGPLTWLLTSELFPTDIRGRALGASTICNFGSAILVTSTFLTMQTAWGSTALFGSYLGISVLGFLFALMAVPETKDKTVEQINADLIGMLWWRR